MYYYGARYYDPRISAFYGVDPLADKAPNWTAFRYGFNNPIRLNDPSGMFESEGDAKKWAKDNNIRTGWFSGTKIQESSDGTWAINNKKEGTSIFRDNNTADFNNLIGGSNSNVITGALGLGSVDANGGGEWLGTAGQVGSYSSMASALLANEFKAASKQTIKYAQVVNGQMKTAAQLTSEYQASMKIMGGAVKNIGTGVSYFNIAITATQLATTNDPNLVAEYTFDLAMGVVGLYGPAAPVAILYTLSKPLNRQNAIYINAATQGFSELGMGFYSINLMPFK